MKTTRWVLLAAILASATGTSAGERPTAEELLGAFQKSVEKLVRVRIECTHTIPDSKGGIEANGTWTKTIEETVIRDGSRWKVDEILRTANLVNGVRSDDARRTQTLVGCNLIQAHEVITATASNAAFENPQLSASLGAFLDDHDDRLWNTIGLTRVLFGRMVGDRGLPLWTVMGEETTLELLPQTETIAGAETYVLKSRGKYGEHKIWLDPECGGLPRRIEIRKGTGALFDDEQLGSRAVPDAPAKPQPGPPPPVAYRDVSCRVDNIQIEKKSGVFVITAFDNDFRVHVVGMEAEGGGRSTYRLRAIDIDPKPFPEGTFGFDVRIEDGREIAVWENARLQFGETRGKRLYEWIGGKPQRRAGN